jgi:two-component system, chemotaxis family, protein-glutamate methylesterase/glutaminase
VIEVLVVDDSITTRELLTALLNRDPEIRVVAQATDGLEAVEMVGQLAPDVITMDINMPRMDGYEATRRIMAENPTPIVVVTSVSRTELVHQGLDVLLAGAADIVEKPSALSDRDYATVAEELIGKVKAVSQIVFQRTTAC